MKLAQLLEGTDYRLRTDGDAASALDLEITDITNDSRKVQPGGLFFAIRGANSDGHAYAAQVAAAGAAVLVVDHEVKLSAADAAQPQRTDAHVVDLSGSETIQPQPAVGQAIEVSGSEATLSQPEAGHAAEASGHEAAQPEAGRGALPVQVVVASTRRAMALISAAYYGHPAQRLKMIGITGTKGKTTTTYLVKSILERAGIDTGLIGTIEMTYHEVHQPAANTTPESIELQRDLKEMADAGVQTVVMEVSSQALMMDRTAGIQYDIGVFTNLSEDHIGPNEHKDFDDYLHCKSLLFRQCDIGIVNGDDPYVDRILESSSCRIERFGMHAFLPAAADGAGPSDAPGAADISETADADSTPEAACAELDGRNAAGGAFAGKPNDLWAENPELVSKPGELGIRFDAKGLIDIPGCEVPTPGSFSIYNAMAAVAICRHYDVAPAQIREALLGARTKGRIELIRVSDEFTLMIDYAHNAVALESLLTTLREYHPHRLVTLFGCGGNRARSRRYEMGEVSGRLSDFTIITSDNPRFEEPMDIIADIVTGISKTDGEYITIPDRKDAIAYAIHHGEPGDIIVLAGKGHEDYQEIRGKKYPMDERVLIREILAEDAGTDGQAAGCI